MRGAISFHVLGPCIVHLTFPGKNARVLFNRIVKTSLCLRIRQTRALLAFKRSATVSLPCLEPKDEDDDGDFDCAIDSKGEL